jgi:hypothetical protein
MPHHLQPQTCSKQDTIKLRIFQPFTTQLQVEHFQRPLNLKAGTTSPSITNP